MLRVRQRTSGVYTFTATAVDEDGQTQAVDNPTIVVKDGAGVTVDSGVPTHSSHPLIYALDATLLEKLDTYTLVWGGEIDGNPWEWVDEVELVGGYLFEIAEIRAFDRTFENANKYPTQTLRDVRTAVEQVIEGPTAGRIAFVPRGRRVTVNGNGVSAGQRVPDFAVREIYSASINGTALTETEIDAIVCDDNWLWRSVSQAWAGGHRNVELHYAHGLDRVPAPIKRAALILAREYLVTSPLPGRATATSIGDQMFRLTVAGRDGVTGLPDVDAAIAQHGRAAYGIR